MTCDTLLYTVYIRVVVISPCVICRPGALCISMATNQAFRPPRPNPTTSDIGEDDDFVESSLPHEMEKHIAVAHAVAPLKDKPDSKAKQKKATVSAQEKDSTQTQSTQGQPYRTMQPAATVATIIRLANEGCSLNGIRRGLVLAKCTNSKGKVWSPSTDHGVVTRTLKGNRLPVPHDKSESEDDESGQSEASLEKAARTGTKDVPVDDDDDEGEQDREAEGDDENGDPQASRARRSSGTQPNYNVDDSFRQQLEGTVSQSQARPSKGEAKRRLAPKSAASQPAPKRAANDSSRASMPLPRLPKAEIFGAEARSVGCMGLKVFNEATKAYAHLAPSITYRSLITHIRQTLSLAASDRVMFRYTDSDGDPAQITTDSEVRSTDLSVHASTSSPSVRTLLLHPSSCAIPLLPYFVVERP